MFHSKQLIVDTTQNNIFAFWESPNPIPAYLDLCRETWVKNIPNCQIHILNHSNLHQYIGDVYDLDKLKAIGFASQSDIISAAVLEKFGGLFLDLDCIVTDDIFSIFSGISENKLIGFGTSFNHIHLSALFVSKPNNPILREWRKSAQYRLSNKPEECSWDYFGNGIINPLLNNVIYKDDFHIINRTTTGNILEFTIFGENSSKGFDNYRKLYFDESYSFSPEILDKVTCGIIALHNSWTPAEYKSMVNKVEFLTKNILLSKLLVYVLNNDTKRTKITLPIVEDYILKSLNNKKIKLKSFGYFREILVLDFISKEVNFAFDVYVKDNSIYLDFVLRNSSVYRVKDLPCFLSKKFNFNKVHIISNVSCEKVFENILLIHDSIDSLGREVVINKFTNEPLKVIGYYQDDRNNIIEAPDDLHNVKVQFFGKNNHVVLHENSNLKNTFIELKGNNSSFKIGEHAGIFGTFRLGHECHIKIGDSTTSTNPVYVTCAEKTSITIGNDCMFATNNQIRTDDSHPIYDSLSGKRVNPSKNIVIGNHVWIAYGATIFGGAELGQGSVIGAYSLVKNSIPNNCVAAGIPAKVIRKNIFWERPLLLNEANEKIFPSEYLQQKGYIATTEE